jgi:hypothetical protein
MGQGMIRFPDWPRRLSKYLEDQKNVPFGYNQRQGEFACCLFTAGAIQAMTGVDVCPEFRGAYNSEREAYVLLRRVCGVSNMEDLAALKAAEYGMREVDVNFGSRGDVFLYEIEGQPAVLGVGHMRPGEIALKHDIDPLMSASKDHAMRCWRI